MNRGIILSLCDYSGAWSRPFVTLGYTVVRVDPMHDAGKETTAGTLVGSSGLVRRMEDGGLSLAWTVGQMRDYFERNTDCWDRNKVLSRFLGCEVTLPVVGILAAPPCTTYSGSGARWWPRHDADGSRHASDAIVRDCLRLVDMFTPDWWAIENPVGRIARCVPELAQAPVKYTFDPCDFAALAEDVDAEAYTKRTVLWGNFDADYLRATAKNTRVEPVMIEKRRKDGTVVRGSWMWANLGGKSERTKALRSKTPSGFARAFALAQSPVIPVGNSHFLRVVGLD